MSPLARDATFDSCSAEEWEAVLSLADAIDAGWISGRTSLLDLPVDVLVAETREVV